MASTASDDGRSAAPVRTSATPAGPESAHDIRISRAGGVAALVKAVTYVIGFGVMAAYLDPRGFGEAQGDPDASLAFLLDNQVAMYLWYLVLYVVGGVALVVLTLALHERLRYSPAAALSRTAAAFGLLWSGLLLASGSVALVGQRAVADLAATDAGTAVSTWSAVGVVQDALGGGVEIVGAVWVLLVGVAGIRSGVLGRGLSVLGIALGVTGAWTLLPMAADGAASLFGLGFVVWFGWIAGVLLRRRA